MRYDVIVVGAGPGGSTAARECASRGLSVLLLDKSEFPRDKPCGGGVTLRTANLLPFDLTPVIERVINRVKFTLQQRSEFARIYSDTVTYFTQRSRLDNFLVGCAVEAGVTLYQRELVRQIERHPDHVRIWTSSGCFESRVLVAADGANGRTAKMAGVDAMFNHGIALEGNITPAGGISKEWEHSMGLDFGGLPGGYGWIFPKSDHLNIGLGGWRYIGPTLRDRLSKLVRFYGFDPVELWGLRGYHLPVRQQGSPLMDGNVLLVGDAAGLLDPLTAEGIYAAVWSGVTSARHISEYVGGQVPDLEGYRREVESELLSELTVSRKLHDVFHLWPGLFVRVEFRYSILWNAVVLMLRGEWTYISVKNKLGRIWPFVELLSDLVRVMPLLRRISGLRDPAPPERFFRRRVHDAV